MASEYRIKQGLDINLAGKPAAEIAEVPFTDCVSVYPAVEFPRMKPRLKVKEGDAVKRGSVLFIDKKNEGFQYRSPAAGTIKAVNLGERRSLQEIVIERADDQDSESFKIYDAGGLISNDRQEILDHLNLTGLFGLLKQRPFSCPADAADTPKSIFVNAMNNAPFRPDAHLAVSGREEAFQAGINALSRLTDGDVHLCVATEAKNADDALINVQNAKLHFFSGPHPSGNTSTHIHNVDPIYPGDIVWTISAVDLLLIGELLITGLVPNQKIVAAGGTGLKDEARKHYLAPIGAPLSSFLADALVEGENRIISGDIFAGDKTALEAGLRLSSPSITVLPEDRSRRFLGWMAPGAKLFTNNKVFISGWINKGKEWTLGTNLGGGHRALVQSGIYDKYVPLNILVDYLSRACMAKDSDEAVSLGILETDPEDFALCSVVCPSKTDFSAIIRKGLNQIEEEGL